MTIPSAPATAVVPTLVDPSVIFSSVVVEVTPSNRFISVVVEVTPSIILSSEVVAVTPSIILSSVAVAVTSVPPISSVVMDTSPATVNRPLVNVSRSVSDVCPIVVSSILILSMTA